MLMASRQAGTTLVELMISMSIGFASLTAMASLVGHGISLNSQLISKSRLQEEINAITGLLINDIKRAGFNANTLDIVVDPVNVVSPFRQSLQVDNYPGETSNSCILYSYDRNENGLLDAVNPNEYFGFRLKDKAIEIRIDGLNCDSNGWHDLTDPNVVEVTSLQFVDRQQIINGVNALSIELLITAQLVNDSAISKRVYTAFNIKNYD